MELTTFAWTTFAAFLTLAIYSFLYRDNPMYKFAEHLVVGVSAGYFVVILWHGTLVPNLLNRLADGNWLYVVPLTLGLMMWSRFFPSLSWVSRIPLALYVGIGSGLAIPQEFKARVNNQLVAAMDPINWDNFFGERFLDITAGYSELLLFLGTICALIYFFFSKAHTGAFGGMARIGLWTLMLGFGSAFGFTVMARISLFINRIQFLENNWWRNGFGDGASSSFMLVGSLALVPFVVYALIEITRSIRSKRSDLPTS